MTTTPLNHISAYDTLPDCEVCNGTGWDAGFSSDCNCQLHRTGGAFRAAARRVTPVGGRQDRIHTPGERMDGRTFGSAHPDALRPSTPSEAQVRFCTTLLAEVYPGQDERQATMLARFEGLTRKAASEGLDRLIAMRDAGRTTRPVVAPASSGIPGQDGTPPLAAPARVLPDVPAGHYAVDNAEGILRFYEVDRPTEGRWAGRTFVSVLASDERHPVKGAAGAAVLAKIAEDPMAAMLRYGQEIGRCGHCNRTLTDEASRARGIGPVCAGRMGL
jgi:hypothetical protein